MSVRNPNLKFKESMRWEGEVEDYIRKLIVDEATEKGRNVLSLRILNAPSGKSLIGTDRLDIDAVNEPSHIGDINNLPFENETYDIVLQDPVWKLSYYKRMKPFFEAVRVTKKFGLIIYNATWLPSSKAVAPGPIMVRQSADFANVSVISTFRKISTEFDNSAYRKKGLEKGDMKRLAEFANEQTKPKAPVDRREGWLEELR